MRLLASILALVLLSGTAHGWQASPELPHHADLAERAMDGLPPAWRERIVGQLDAYRRGALDPDGVTNPDADVHTFYHTYEPKEGEGGGLFQVQSSLHDATMAMREGKSDEEVAYRLGHLTHFVTDLGVPYHTGDGLYDHEQHGPYETEAYHRQHADLRPSRPSQEVTDVDAYVTDVATRSAAMGDRLVEAFGASEGQWSQEVDAITRELEQLSLDAAADMLHTAFAMADPARPTPAFTEEMPVPEEAEDVGLSLQEQWRQNPGIVLGVGAGALLAGLATGLLLARRRARRGQRPL